MTLKRALLESLIEMKSDIMKELEREKRNIKQSEDRLEIINSAITNLKGEVELKNLDILIVTDNIEHSIKCCNKLDSLLNYNIDEKSTGAYTTIKSNNVTYIFHEKNIQTIGMRWNYLLNLTQDEALKNKDLHKTPPHPVSKDNSYWSDTFEVLDKLEKWSKNKYGGYNKYV